VRENALRKARAVWMTAEPAGAGVVIGCDTIVALDGEIYGKPADLEQARDTLTALSGARHEVLSGLAVLVADAPVARAGDAGDLSAQHVCASPAQALQERAPRQLQERVAVARTTVSFRVLDEGLLEWYLATGEWRGRAGAYAIQGAGAALVRELAGDYENVVGLPVATLLDIYPELLG
jgi:septum formation protein